MFEKLTALRKCDCFMEGVKALMEDIFMKSTEIA